MSGRVDTRERMLLLMQLLNLPHGITVPEFQRYCRHVFGIEPGRNAVYQDLYAIEKYVPLKIHRPKNGSTFYRYSSTLIDGDKWGEGESE